MQQVGRLQPMPPTPASQRQAHAVWACEAAARAAPRSERGTHRARASQAQRTRRRQDVEWCCSVTRSGGAGSPTGVLLVGVHLYLIISSLLVAVAFSSSFRSSGYMSSGLHNQPEQRLQHCSHLDYNSGCVDVKIYTPKSESTVHQTQTAIFLDQTCQLVWPFNWQSEDDPLEVKDDRPIRPIWSWHQQR